MSPPRRNPDPFTLSEALRIIVRQFGAGVLIAVAFGYSTVRVYYDLAARNSELVLLIREQVESSAAVTSALRELASSIEQHVRK